MDRTLDSTDKDDFKLTLDFESNVSQIFNFLISPQSLNVVTMAMVMMSIVKSRFLTPTKVILS